MTLDPGVVDNHFLTLQNSQFSELFKKAEIAIKLVEHRHSELIIPAINELRYAGYHITVFADNPTKKEELDRACGHCKRATYDAYEASILFCVEEYNQFQKDYKDCVIPDILHDYIEKKQAIKKAVSFIDSIDKETRAKNYEQCKKYHEELVDIIDSLNEARTELNKKLKAEQKEVRKFILGIVVAIASIFVAIAICLFQYTNLKNDAKKSIDSPFTEQKILKNNSTHPPSDTKE